MPLNKRVFGRAGECSAALYLERSGFRIIGRNVFVGHREIDIIAENGIFLAFVEVKTRRAYPDITKDCFGRPIDSVDNWKSDNLMEAANQYLRENREAVRGLKPRADVIEVYVDPVSTEYRPLEIRYYPNEGIEPHYAPRRRYY